MAETSACRIDAPPLGRFISFEGGEGAGKSTQIQRLRHRLAAHGFDTIVTREPGGSPRAEEIRAILLSGRAKGHGALAETLLFAAARADHVDHTIEPALGRGAFVLCDRFIDSTRVYQGALAGLPDTVLGALERATIGDTRPDLTLILDLPVEIGLVRAGARRTARGETVDRFEAEDASYHAEIRRAFLAIAQREPERCVVVDAGGSPDEVEARIWSAVEARLGGWKRASRVG
ncbi:dTMP kinase [uncultured Enterovirga sp.]|uniref:dTMP kinase n=1 Tax=uncultured Enterovirga sp. TaxID=2026352 RepID=UPI0035CC2B54